MTKLLASATLLLSVASAQTLLVLNKEGSVAIVDAKTNIITGKVPTGPDPHEVIASTDGKLAVSSNYGTAQVPGHTLSVIDLATKKEIHRVDVGPLERPHGLFAADGKIYFTSEQNKIIARYDPAKNVVDWSLGTGQDGTHMVALTKDRNLIFTSNIRSGTVTIFERANNDWRATVVKVGPGAEGFDISPDEKQLWAANAGDGTISVVDIAKRQTIDTFPIASKRSNRLKFTPDGKTALVSDLTSGEVIVVDVATRKAVKHFAVGKGVAGILITPDGSRAYAACTGDNWVSIIDLKTMEVTGKIQTGTGPDGMDWIPSR
jgi:YVTN family beta-propeller protein